MKTIQRIAVATVLLVVLVGLVACTGGGGTGGGGTGSGTSEVTVSLTNFSFQPSDIQVAVGGTVKFVNNDSTTHDIVGEGWDSGQLAPGASFSQTFPTAGTFPIHCSIHPSMTAQVTVK